MARMKLHAAAMGAVLATGLTGDDMLRAAKNAYHGVATSRPLPVRAITEADAERIAAAQAKRERKAAKRARRP